MAVTPGTLGYTEPASPNKRADADTMTRSAVVVQREVVSIGSPDDATPEQIAAVTSANALKVDGSAVTQPVSGTLTAAQGAAAAASGAWPTKPTDAAGVNQLAITAAGDAKVTLDGEAVVLGAGTADIGDVTVLNAAGAAAVNIQDGGNSITVDGTVSVTEPVSVDDNSGSLTVDAPAATPVAVRQSDGAAFFDPRLIQGDVANDAADGTSNPVKVGGRASGAVPAAVAAADRVDAYHDREGRQIVRPWGAGAWAVVNFPAANTRASVTRAAGAAGVRHVCTGLTVVLAGGTTAPAAVQLDVRLRDGILDTGTILWQAVITLPATAGAMNGIAPPGLQIPGTAATAMTLEFSAAGGANTFESVSLQGVDITEA